MYSEVYVNASEAFLDLYQLVDCQKVSPNGTKKVHNVSIKLLAPLDNHIKVPQRKWNPVYANREWDWYISENRSVEELKKFAPIWDTMHGGDNIVNSNYGYLWNRNGQLDNVINELQSNPLSRRAWITIFDGKEHEEYKFDTPCTQGIGFMIEDGLLCMSVQMRSNDIWFGFSNDQYCFSKLQGMVAQRLGIAVGWYFHYAADMHLYKPQFNLI